MRTRLLTANLWRLKRNTIDISISIRIWSVCSKQKYIFRMEILNQAAITKDAVHAEIDAVLYFQVQDPYSSSYNIDNHQFALYQLVIWVFKMLIVLRTLHVSQIRISDVFIWLRFPLFYFIFSRKKIFWHFRHFLLWELNWEEWQLIKWFKSDKRSIKGCQKKNKKKIARVTSHPDILFFFIFPRTKSIVDQINQVCHPSWGLTCHNYEVMNFLPPKIVLTAMEKQVRSVISSQPTRQTCQNLSKPSHIGDCGSRTSASDHLSRWGQTSNNYSSWGKQTGNDSKIWGGEDRANK